MNLIDKLLSVDKEELTKECTKTYHSKNMERLTGDGEITLRKVKERKLRERALNTLDKKGNLLLVNAHDSDLLVLMDGVKEPNLKDERLLEHFGAATPKDLFTKTERSIPCTGYSVFIIFYQEILQK